MTVQCKLTRETTDCQTEVGSLECGQCRAQSKAGQSQPGLLLGWKDLWTKPIKAIVRMKNFKQRKTQSLVFPRQYHSYHFMTENDGEDNCVLAVAWL